MTIQIFFIDDTFINMVPTMPMNNWVNVLHIEGIPTKQLSDNLLVSDKIKISELTRSHFML